ncbi:1-deoxy-D-xylulose-5-phosphate reductoisomerase [Pelistega europaea]|uniref:1-deoxy-D-xylulose 5-phosphate reductoisomerase n=1 Tax=Pelistega europaea TaxID=106147 RepID=A0A7Y4P5Q8_9BURK|nr:1-deoxy-D-xylulose-5-phosphate reductoisomerase [Pelistega europaea]NOL48975.1 1-deoxy-D-xylulose-5-phosphate reductoisomerase [Pelistega europaea]
MQSIVVFGATGSIGDSTLDIIACHPERYQVYALSAFSRMEKLVALTQKFQPKVVIVPDEARREQFLTLNKEGFQPAEIRLGQEGLCETARDSQADTIVCAIVGAAGLPSAYAAAKAGKRILLANKEVLVTAGSLFMQAVGQYGATLLPLDSEHNAIFQCLPKHNPKQHLQKVIITASGGPFREYPLEQLVEVTPEQACKHPNWNMGRKISVDSATMVNKGLEVIEAKWLFDLEPAQIDVVIHPQSTIHSMVQFVDGSLLAQLGNHDMRIPISYALGYPERITHNAAHFDLAQLTCLDFSAPDFKRYPCLRLAFDALKEGIGACTILNASNEIAVAQFLTKRIKFTQIAQTIAQMLNSIVAPELCSIDDVLAFDAEVRERTLSLLEWF